MENAGRYHLRVARVNRDHGQRRMAKPHHRVIRRAPRLGGAELRLKLFATASTHNSVNGKHFSRVPRANCLARLTPHLWYSPLTSILRRLVVTFVYGILVRV